MIDWSGDGEDGGKQGQGTTESEEGWQMTPKWNQSQVLCTLGLVLTCRLQSSHPDSYSLMWGDLNDSVSTLRHGGFITKLFSISNGIFKIYLIFSQSLKNR